VAKVMEPLGDADIPRALTERLDLQVLAEPVFPLSPASLSPMSLALKRALDLQVPAYDAAPP